MSGGVRDLAGVLAAHEPDVTSYDAGDIHGCECGWDLPTGLGWDDKWPAYHAHVAEQLERVVAEARAEALREAADEWTQGAWANHMVHASDPAQIRIGSANRFGEWLRGKSAALGRQAGGGE